MALVFSLSEANAHDLLEARYTSTQIPFKNIAEMMATLSTIYDHDNQLSQANEELSELEYNPDNKTMDIHQYIDKANSLANKAGIVKAKCTAGLLEYIHANIDLHLLQDSKDMTIPYETFVGAVEDDAMAK
jgi:hypothetical protein